MKGICGYGRYDDAPNIVGCPRANSDMTPCIARDGATALSDDLMCVGCNENPKCLLDELDRAGVSIGARPSEVITLRRQQHAADKLRAIVSRETALLQTATDRYKLTTPIDGLSESEYQRRYQLATQNRALKNQLGPAEMLSVILDLISRPRSDLLNETYTAVREAEAMRDYFDLGDWMKFLHSQYYKPGWKVELVPRLNHPWSRLAMELSATVKVPTHAGTEADQEIVSRAEISQEWCRTEQDADRILTGMIEDCERKIMLAWRRKPADG